MESIAGESTFLRLTRRLALVGVAASAMSGCAQPEARKGVPQAIYEDYGTPHYRDGQIYDYYTGIATGSSDDVIIAAADGTVDYVSASADQQRIFIYHGRDQEGLHLRTEYWHYRANFVKEGDSVTRGQRIGIVGGGDRKFLYFRFVKAPENLYGNSSAWIPENPHDHWLDGPGKITCFDPRKIYPKNSSEKLTWPLQCR